jgi:TolB-like protein/DNA-binding winged helix-turn-helix (wHTH) protein
MKDNNCTSQANELPEADQKGFDEANLSGMVLLINGFEVDTATNSISKEGSESRLEPRAMELLVYLAQKQNQVISRDELETEVWQNRVVGYDALNSTIAKLRKAFGDDPKNPAVIQTVPKAGYRLIAELSIVASGTDSFTSLGLHPATPIENSSRPWQIMISGLTLLIVVGLMFWFKPWGGENYPQLPAQPSLVVLPLKNLSADAEQEMLSAAISADITNQLSRFGDLFVISSDSANFYRDADKPPKIIGRELGVRYVLSGTMLRAQNDLRVAMVLIEAETGFQIWTEEYHRSVNDLFVVRDDIVKSVVTSLGEKIWRSLAAKLQAKPLENFAAYDFHLKAQEALHRLTAESNLEARSLWIKASELDPDLGWPFLGLAWTHYMDYRAQWTDTGPEALDKAVDYLDQSSVTLGDSYDIHRLLAKISQARGEFDKALSHSERALELNPNDGDLLANYAQMMTFAGKSEQALPWINDAILRNPHYPGWYASVRSMIYYLKKDYPAAINDLNKLTSPAVWDRRYLAASYAQLFRKEEAQKQVNLLLESDPEFTLAAYVPKLKFQLDSDRDHFIDGLQKAGFPQ